MRQRKTAPRPRGARPVAAQEPDARLGSVRAVLAGVGNDPAKAQDAFDREAASSSPRKSLLASLARIMRRPGASDEPEPEHEEQPEEQPEEGQNP